MNSSKVNLNGRVLRVATNLNPPFITFNDSTPNGGSEITMLNAMSNYFSFKYELIDCHADWGVKHHDGSWTGIVGKIANNEADMGMAGVLMDLNRGQVVDFLNTHYLTAISFITPPPKKGQSLEILVMPFDSYVWICLLLSVILMVINVWLLSYFDEALNRLSLKWLVVSLILKQTVIREVPNSQPLKYVLTGWLLACVVFIQSYGSRLYSMMAFPQEIRPINTVDELARLQRTGDIQVVTTRSSLFYNWLKTAKFGVYKDIGDLLEPINSKEQGLSMVRDRSGKSYAYISTRDNLLYGVLSKDKNYYHVPPDNDHAPIYFSLQSVAVSKNFPYKKQFNWFISQLISGGFIDYWIAKEFRKVDAKYDLFFNSQYSHEDYRAMSFTQFKSILLVCVWASISAIFLLLVENVLDGFIIVKFLFKLLPYNKL